MRKRMSWKSYLNGYVIILLLFVTACMYYHSDSPWSKFLPWVDSDVFLYGGWAMHQGEVLYVDFFDHKGPYMFFLQWLGWGLTNSYTGVWAVELVFGCITILASFATVRKFGWSRPVSMAITIIGYSYLSCYLYLGNYTEAYVLPMISASAYIFLSYFADGRHDLSTWECICLGALCMSAFLIRPNSIAVWVAFCMVITLHHLWLKDYKNIGKYIVFFFTGAGAALVPVLLYLTKYQAWSGFWEFFQFNFQYVEAGGNILEAVKYFFMTPIAVLSFAGMIAACIDEWRKKRCCLQTFSCIVWYLLGMYFTCMAGGEWDHYGCMMLPVYVIGISFLFSVIKNQTDQIEYKNVRFFIYVLVLGTGICIAIIDPKGNWKTIQRNQWILFDSPENDREVKEIAEIIKQETDETDRISVFGNACRYYLTAERKSVSKWIYQNPLYYVDQEIGELYVAELTEKKPAAIVIQDKRVLEDSENRIAQKLGSMLQKEYEDYYEGTDAKLFFRKGYEK